MRALGHDRFVVTGQDRGSYVAFRLAMGHPAAVSHLVVIEAAANGRQAWEDYQRAIHDPATIHAMCEDYRAGLGIDRQLKRIAADRGYRLVPRHDPVAWPALTAELAARGLRGLKRGHR